MVFSFIQVFHKFNYFLGTSAGGLLKHSSELILLTFASYMVASEWLRTRTRNLKYLLIGFGSLALQKLIATLFFTQIVFGGATIHEYAERYIDYINLAQNFFEITALILISTAFLYAVHEKHHISLRKKTYIELGIVALFFAFSTAVALNIVPFLPFGIKRKLIYSSLEIIKIAMLWFPIYIFWKHKELTLYNRNVALAFLIYSITPLLTLINIVWYYGRQIDLAIIANPFPFIAIALFSRVLFLKLVDKATIKEELMLTRQKYVREKEISTMKDEFVSTVSHELRTPLTSIRLYLSILLQEKVGPVNEKQKEILHILSGESNRLTRLINNILNLSRFEQEKEKLDIRKTNLLKLVESSIYPHLLEEKNLNLVKKIQPNLDVMLDPEKFKQVIINLVTNAVKYTPKNGTLTLSAYKKGRNTMITIVDTGRGIPKEALPYIFDKFYQAEHHMTRTTGGLGLGLAIVKKIIDLHNGEIKVKSTINKGTTFTITLPELKNESAEQHQPVPEKAPGA